MSSSTGSGGSRDVLWPYPVANMAAAAAMREVPRDEDARTLPRTLPSPLFDHTGAPIPESAQVEQVFESGQPILVDGRVAEVLLSFNLTNRQKREAHIKRLLDAMLSDNWMFNGQSSSLACSNTSILNGQHTFTALSRAFAMAAAQPGLVVKPVLMVPYIGLHPSVFRSLDTVNPRTVVDTFVVDAQRGCLDLQDISANHWSTAVRVLLQYLNMVQDLPADSLFHLDRLRSKLSNSHVTAIVNAAPQLRTSMGICGQIDALYSRPVVSLSVAAVLHAIISDVQSETAATKFVRALATGANLETDSPIYKLREQIIRERGLHRRTENINLLASCVRAWNLIATGRPAPARRISDFNADGSFPEPLPLQRRVAR